LLSVASWATRVAFKNQRMRSTAWLEGAQRPSAGAGTEVASVGGQLLGDELGGPAVDIEDTGVGDVGQARLLVPNNSAQKPKVSPVTIWSRVSREAGVRLLWARSRTRTGSIVSGIRSPPGTGMRNQGMPRAVSVKWSRR